MHLATNAVTVNGGLADRKVEYFHREIVVNNGSGPVWHNVEVVSGGTTNKGGVLFPDDNQTLSCLENSVVQLVDTYTAGFPGRFCRAENGCVTLLYLGCNVHSGYALGYNQKRH